MYSLHTHDTFFFRGNGEFTSGENSFTSGLFPPNPQTLYGALRGNWIEQYGTVEAFISGAYREKVGTPDSHGALQLNGVYLSLDDYLYVPLPQHTQVLKSDTGILTAHPLKLVKGSNRESDDAGSRLIGVSRKKSTSPDGKWIKAVDWKTLMIKKEPVDVLTVTDFIEEQPKIGIYVDNDSGTAKDGMLYQYSRNVLKETAALVIDAHLPDPLDLLTMGNKGTLWSMEKEPELREQLNFVYDAQAILPDVEQSKMIAVTLLTPALVTSELIDEQTKVFNYTKTNWIQSAIPRPVHTGGWDIVKKRPKPRYTMLKPGTTFIITTPDESIEDFLDEINSTLFSDEGQEEGYGRVIISPIQFEEERV